MGFVQVHVENYESEDNRLQYLRIKKWAKISFHRHLKSRLATLLRLVEEA